MTDSNTKKPANWTRRIAISALTLGALTVAGLGYAASKGRGPDDMMGGPGFGHMEHMGGPMGGFGADFMEFRMNKILDRVDATAEQKQKIKAIFEKTRDAMEAERGQPDDMRQQMIDLLKAPTIDAAAVETLRANRTAKMEDRSKTMTSAIIEAANVLTPEQRVKLADEMQSHGPRR
jgi:periplasmic protein CpxP/Spy